MELKSKITKNNTSIQKNQNKFLGVFDVVLIELAVLYEQYHLSTK